MKKNIVKNKHFLKKIFKSNKLESVIKKASSEELDALLYAINFVVTKKVPLADKTIHQISKIRQKTPAFLRFENTFHEQFENLLNSKEAKKIKTIISYAPMIKKVLSPYFTK